MASESNRDKIGITITMIRIILINPLTQQMTVIGGSDGGFDSVLNDLRWQEGTDEIESLGGECVICLDEKKIGDVVKEMSCKHKFHGGCVDRWQLIYGSCSVCRHKMPADDLGKKIGDEIRRSRR
ncbi:hypothetical protein R6Q59_031501 [Mikania micrantha]